ncbi:uncharacterized protein N7473_010534 [Penicillium subrubescens]|uniref:Uncharacterized protein n=1 Tax=Penicillium subrubescens TaxID=1316194 RepID=A0A1Q5SZG5_9EURO|nr:uncharacterized protein N7473_010534 [Penicillium subrubescens]KAJ5883648.1 hypothetical protein N7473_010534 [Penicillium subrubescens]OKO93398.1 hypothetical protein PENSUB_12461 [Penicillium subrubescens]
MSATASSLTGNRHERAPLPSDDDYTSSSGPSSSESESEEEDSEDEDQEIRDDQETTIPAPEPSIPHIGGRPKPSIHRMEGGSDLLSRLSSFLPQMKNANEDLEKKIAAGKGQEMVLDSVDDDGKDYIEMNLGLGVLEEKRGDNEDSSSDDEGDDENPDGDSQKSKENADSDLLGQLMGAITCSSDKPKIEEMAD